MARSGRSAQGHGEATLVLEPMPCAAALDPLSLALRLDDPKLPPLQLALDGEAQLSEQPAQPGRRHDQ